MPLPSHRAVRVKVDWESHSPLLFLFRKHLDFTFILLRASSLVLWPGIPTTSILGSTMHQIWCSLTSLHKLRCLLSWSIKLDFYYYYEFLRPDSEADRALEKILRIETSQGLNDFIPWLHQELSSSVMLATCSWSFCQCSPPPRFWDEEDSWEQ